MTLKNKESVLNKMGKKSVRYLTMMKEINLLENPSPTMCGHLINDLDGVLHFRKYVDAGSDRGVSTLAEHFSGKAIQFMKCVWGQGSGAGCFLLSSSPRLGLFFSIFYDFYGPSIFFCCKIHFKCLLRNAFKVEKEGLKFSIPFSTEIYTIPILNLGVWGEHFKNMFFAI